MSATAQADAAIAELRRAYYDGLKRVGFTAADAAALLAAGPLALAALSSSSSSRAAIAKNMADLQPRVEDWAMRRRGWAEAGHREDGSSYSWSRWFPEGKDLSDAVAYHTGEAANASLFAVVASTVVQTASDVKAAVGGAVKPLESLVDHLHIVAAGAGACAVAYVVWRLAR